MTNAACDLEVGSCCGPPEPFNWAAWWRVGIGVVIAANSMTVSLAIDTSEATGTERVVVHWVLFGLALVSVALLGWPLARNAVRALAERRLTIEAMFSAGIVGSMVASAVAALTGTGDVYFEIVCILLVVYSLGQQLTAVAQDRALRAAAEWAPGLTTCTVEEADGTLREIPVEELTAGQVVLVGPGQTIAADGVVASGEAFVREAEMTGEHHAAVRRPGDRVWAGTHSVDATLRVRATAGGTERRIDRILDAVQRARQVPSTLQFQADRLVAWFLPVVATIATATFAGWAWAQGWQVALFNAMAVLLVACPCALGLATPLAVWAAVGRLASRGLLVRGGDVIERLAAADTAVFDKTGTLTESRASLVDLLVAGKAGLDRSQVLGLLQAVQRRSSHPVAAAFHELGGVGETWVVDELRVAPAVGVEASVREQRSSRVHQVRVGSASRMWQDPPEQWSVLRQGLRSIGGAREIAVEVDGELVAGAVVDERLRSSWPEALDRLRELGIDTVVMTGDTAERAHLTQAGAILAGMRPEDKLEEVRRIESQGRSTLFVGDGVNDAAAMAAADLSVGVATGAELAVEVADVTWHGEDLRVVPEAIELVRDTVSTIRSNLVLAASYNAVGMALAAGGVLHPVAAAVLMTCSSLVVTWRAMGVLQEEQESTGEPGFEEALA